MSSFDIDQDSYAFYSDGSESGSVIIGTANNGITVGDEGGVDKAFDTTILFRALLQSDGGKDGTDGFRLKVSKNSGAYDALSAVSGITAINSTNLTQGDDCTQRVGAGTFVTDNNGVGDDGDTTSATIPNGQEIEVLFSFEIDETLVSDGDTFDFHVYHDDDSAVNTYTTTGTVTVDKVIVYTGLLETLDFEEGNLTDWDSTSGTPSATSGAALVGTYGMEVYVDGIGTDELGVIALTHSTDKLRFRFYYDPNSIAFGATDWVRAIRINTSTTPVTILAVYVRHDGTSHGVDYVYTDDESAENNPSFTQVDITDAPHWIEILIVRETADGQADGYVDLWVDDVLQTRLSGLDNYLSVNQIDEFEGGNSGDSGGPTGNIYFDDFIIRDDDTQIGEAGGGPTVLVVADIAQAQVIDSVILTQHNVLVVADVTQAQVIEAPTLTVILVVQDIAQAQTIENVDLVINLIVADIAQAQVIDAPVLTQHNVLAVADTTQAQTTESPVLVVTLVVADIAQAQTIENVEITYYPPGLALVVADVAQAQTTDNVALTQHNILTIADTAQAQVIDSPTLTVALVVADIAQAQTTENIVIDYHPPGSVVLIVQDTAQAQVTDNVALTQHNILVIADAAQAQVIDNIDLVQHYGPLVVADISQLQSIDNVTITQNYVLAVGDIIQLQVTDNVTLTPILVPADIAQAQVTDNVTLTQHNIIVVADAAQVQDIENVVLSPIADSTGGYSQGGVFLASGGLASAASGGKIFKAKDQVFVVNKKA